MGYAAIKESPIRIRHNTCLGRASALPAGTSRLFSYLPAYGVPCVRIRRPTAQGRFHGVGLANARREAGQDCRLASLAWLLRHEREERLPSLALSTATEFCQSAGERCHEIVVCGRGALKAEWSGCIEGWEKDAGKASTHDGKKAEEQGGTPRSRIHSSASASSALQRCGSCSRQSVKSVFLSFSPEMQGSEQAHGIGAGEGRLSGKGPCSFLPCGCFFWAFFFEPLALSLGI
ncbi:hypothetical protein V8C37DRAFT_206072 [Trichoderma ceciliae]